MDLPVDEQQHNLGVMKGLAVDFSFALLLLVDLVLGQPFPGMHPDGLLRGMGGGSRRSVQRHQGGRLPLYMMQLYRTMLTEDRAGSPPASVSTHTRTEDNPALHDSDSVISLVAKSEYSALKWLFFFFLNGVWWDVAVHSCALGLGH